MSLPVLAAPVPRKPLILYIFAQERSVGALFAQENDECKENALYYLSRMMTLNELNYSPIKKLCLAYICHSNIKTLFSSTHYPTHIQN